MKTIHIIHWGLCMLLIGILSSCSESDPVVENPSGETFIYRLNIVNGDITGTGLYAGELDEANHKITFTIPAESDIQAVKFQGKLSLGAHLDKESYDFLESLNQEVQIINGENIATYQVVVTLEPAKENPVLQKMTVKLDDGTQTDAFISYIDQTVYLKATHSDEVEIVSVTCLPKRATYTLTKGANGKVHKDDPGEIILDFMGFKETYDLSFGNTPIFGGNFGSPVIYDFSSNPSGAAIHPDFAAENTRSADFDGEKVLIVSRQGGNFPKVLYYDDLKEGDTSAEKVLNMTGLSGGTYVISAGRISHGHIYIANLTTGLAGTAAGMLKIYHWSDENAVPEAVFTFDGTWNGESLSKGRYGDNLSVCLDENGNGYIFMFTQDGTQMLRLEVTNFTTIGNPYVAVPPLTVSYYASVNQVDGAMDEYVLTSTRAVIVLMDKDGNVKYKMNAESVPTQGTDARIINFNFERYLIMTTGRANYGSDPVQTFYVYDLSSGANTIQALTAFEEGDKIPLLSYTLDGVGASAYAANTGWGIVNDKLRLFGAAVRSGFVLTEISKKTNN